MAAASGARNPSSTGSDQSRGRRPFLDAFSPSVSANLAAILRVGRDNDLSYETLMLRPESVLIAGTCAAWNQCEKLSTRLKQMGYSVRLDRRETSGDGRIHFSIMPGATGG